MKLYQQEKYICPKGQSIIDDDSKGEGGGIPRRQSDFKYIKCVDRGTLGGPKFGKKIVHVDYGQLV